MAVKHYRAVVLVAAAAVAAPFAATGGGAAYASGRPALANESGNPYFPLVVGSTWRYRDVGGPTGGSTFAIHVVGAQKTAAGEAVQVRDTMGTATVTDRYVIGANGAIDIEVAAGKGAASTTVSADGRYFIPSASQVASCHPCAFTTAFTIAGPGGTLKEHMAETATSAGVQTVHVPAGTFQAEKLDLVVKITSVTAVVSSTGTASYAVYLVKGTGMVETSAGSVTASVMGHTFKEPISEAELLAYTP